MKALRKAVGQLGEMVGLPSSSSPSNESSEDESLEEARMRVEQLRSSMKQMKMSCATFANHAIAMG